MIVAARPPAPGCLRPARWWLVFACILVACIPAPASGSATGETHSLIERGDRLLAEGRREEAGALFAMAWRREGAAAPFEMRLSLARRLGWAGRYEDAIDALRGVAREQHDHIEARILLARYLSWTGRHREAMNEADRVLALQPDNRDARLIKANAASWRGDHASALPLYRGLLAEKEDFDVRLAYTHALLAREDYREAKRSHWWLYAASNHEEMRAARGMLRELRLRSTQNLRIEQTRFEDSEHNVRDASAFRLNIPHARGVVGLRGGYAEVSDPMRVDRAARLALDGRLRLGDVAWFSAAAGFARAGIDDRVTEPIGGLTLEGRAGDWQGRLGFERDLFEDTAAILGARIVTREINAEARYMPHDRLSVDAELVVTDYSDGNRSGKASATPRLALRLDRPHVSLGYRRERLEFERQSGGGYFDPDWLVADQALFSVMHSGERLDLYLELFYGRQEFHRFGARQRDRIAGGNADISYRLGDRFSIGAQFEGGNYALGVATGFRYYSATLRATACF